MKQWVELDSTKASNETSSKRSEDRLSTKGVGLDKEEETEEALILVEIVFAFIPDLPLTLYLCFTSHDFLTHK